jgi:hypothetical protein
MRAINVQLPTKISAGLLPPLRQTARWLLVFFGIIHLFTTFSGCTSFSSWTECKYYEPKYNIGS